MTNDDVISLVAVLLDCSEGKAGMLLGAIAPDANKPADLLRALGRLSVKPDDLSDLKLTWGQVERLKTGMELGRLVAIVSPGVCNECNGTLRFNGGTLDTPIGRCSDCGKVQRLIKAVYGQGSKRLTGKRLTGAEKTRRWREKKRAEEAARKAEEDKAAEAMKRTEENKTTGESDRKGKNKTKGDRINKTDNKE